MKARQYQIYLSEKDWRAVCLCLQAISSSRDRLITENTANVWEVGRDRLSVIVKHIGDQISRASPNPANTPAR